MLLAFSDLSRVQLVPSAAKEHPSKVRSELPFTQDGETVELAANGYADLPLTVAQDEAFRAIIADEAAKANVVATGSITLPNGGKRGKPVATGPTFATLFATPEPVVKRRSRAAKNPS